MEERYVRKVKDHEGCRNERQDQEEMDEEVTESTVIWVDYISYEYAGEMKSLEQLGVVCLWLPWDPH